MNDGPQLYVHIADDGGLLVVDGQEGRSAWVTEAELARRIDVLVAAGGSVLLSQERGSAAATPVVVSLEAAGARVVEATEPPSWPRPTSEPPSWWTTSCAEELSSKLATPAATAR